ncbi:MAG TPA: UDP-N-acetylmuramate dehydrogenase [Candidatus Doudnabacteria bacterium]|nr:UDP-N-acetylmuramate dehydrogenase [Candidatus Doudnabacteria bacterium]
MQIKEHAPLLPYTSFYIGGPCRYLIYAQTSQEIVEATRFAQTKNLPLLVFGGGSNLLVSDAGFSGVAVRVETVGMDIINETATELELKVASGEVWDDVVRSACEENWWGIENLSHIPGFAGAFAVQNVGAYGQEASSVVLGVEVLDRRDLSTQSLTLADLRFGYRRSIFNSIAKDRYVILHTILRLQKNGQPNLSYGDLAERFAGQTPSIQEVRRAVIEIRNQKFPYPNKPTRGNAGSFFRGKLLSGREFSMLEQTLAEQFGAKVRQRLTAMQDRLRVPQGFKTPVAFLIELCVGKDLVVGGARINSNQPAIIINYSGQATASDVLQLFRQVRAEVFNQTRIQLEVEPELIGFPKHEIADLKFNNQD